MAQFPVTERWHNLATAMAAKRRDLIARGKFWCRPQTRKLADPPAFVDELPIG